MTDHSDEAPRLYIERATTDAQRCACGTPAVYLAWVMDGDDEREGSEFGICMWCAYERWAN